MSHRAPNKTRVEINEPLSSLRPYLLSERTRTCMAQVARDQRPQGSPSTPCEAAGATLAEHMQANSRSESGRPRGQRSCHTVFWHATPLCTWAPIMIGLAHAVGAGKAQDWRVLRSPRRLGPGEVAALQCRVRVDAAPRVVGQEPVEEVHAVDADLRPGVADGLPTLETPLGERRLEVRQIHEAWPLLDRGRPQLLEDLEDGTDFRVACEQRKPRRHLCNSATDTPDVRSRSVVRATEEDLRGPVPNSDHLGRVIADEHGVGPREVEVRNLQSQLGVDEEVLRLQVTVQDPVGMTELDPIAQLVGQVLDDLGIENTVD
mmetsp:Transcript_114435/g.363713  ORF Transcript_114435/g.363713 Transcript_114435/m.363713 type:complete len:318 (+) Transcript_114435:233-1186(+)